VNRRVIARETLLPRRVERVPTAASAISSAAAA
jgi:hypothetical protein